jgi:O-antigen ligase
MPSFILNRKNIIYSVISIFPILLISGPFLSDLFCVILGFMFIVYLIRKKLLLNLYNEQKLYLNFFLFFFIYINFNSIFSFDPKISFYSSFTFIRILLFIFALSFFISNDHRVYFGFYLVFFITIILLFFHSSIQYFFNYDFLLFQEIHQQRISSFFDDELIMGSFATRILPIALGCSFLINLKNKNILNILLMTLSGFLVLMSAERLALFYYIGICFIYFFLNKKYLSYFIVIFLSFLFLSSLVKTSTIDRLYKQTFLQMTQTTSIFSYRHSLHYITAYDMFLDKKIFGHGLKSFRHLCSEIKYEKTIQAKQEKDIANLKEFNEGHEYIKEYKNGCNTHPHNIYLEYAAELGGIGLVFLIIQFFYVSRIFIFKFVKTILSNKKNHLDISQSIILGGVFLQLFPLVPSGSFFNNWMMIIFHLSIGFYLSTLKLK